MECSKCGDSTGYRYRIIDGKTLCPDCACEVTISGKGIPQDPEQAFLVADENRNGPLTDHPERTACLVNAAEGQESVGAPSVAARLQETAKLVIDEALQVARRMTDHPFKSSELSTIAGAMAQHGRTDEAQHVARSIESESDRFGAFAEIAKSLAEGNRGDEALRIARSIGEVSLRAATLAQCSTLMARQGMAEEANAAMDQALQQSQAIQGGPLALMARWRTLGYIVVEMDKQGRIDEALQVARTIDDTRERSNALVSVAEALANQGKRDRALQVARGGNSDWACRLIAEALAKQGATGEALEVTKAIQDAWTRSAALGNIAGTMAEEGKTDEAVQLAQDIEKDSNRFSALLHIAEAMAERGATKKAAHVTRGIREVQLQSQALVAIARAEAISGSPRKARKLLANALKVARRIQGEASAARTQSVIHIGETMGEQGMTGEARAVMQEALHEARTMDDPGGVGAVGNALGAIARAMLRYGTEEDAQAFMDEVLEVARNIPDVRKKVRTLVAIANALIAGDVLPKES